VIDRKTFVVGEEESVITPENNRSVEQHLTQRPRICVKLLSQEINLGASSTCRELNAASSSLRPIRPGDLKSAVTSRYC
jgi:hypothetical protein